MRFCVCVCARVRVCCVCCVQLELEALAKMGKESKGGEGKFRSRLRSFGAAIRRSSRQVDDETTTRTTVPTFLRVGASTDWERADKCETAVRARIYLAGFGDLQARGGILAHDDPKIAGILKWAATWSLGDAESMQETIKELKANGGVIFISCDIQGFKAVNDSARHAARQARRHAPHASYAAWHAAWHAPHRPS